MAKMGPAEEGGPRGGDGVAQGNQWRLCGRDKRPAVEGKSGRRRRSGRGKRVARARASVGLGELTWPDHGGGAVPRRTGGVDHGRRGGLAVGTQEG